MPAVPTPGASNNTWGTELNAHLVVHANASSGALFNILQNSADTDTILDLGSTTTDKVTITAGNEVLLTLTESTQDEVIVGDGGDVDFKVLSTGSLEAVHVNGANGIVTLTSPNAVNLTIARNTAGTASMEISNTADNWYMGVPSGVGSFAISTQENVALGTEFVIMADGKIGIGTKTPVGNLQVNADFGADQTAGLYLINTGTATTADVTPIAFSTRSSNWGTIHAATIACETKGGLDGGGELFFSTTASGSDSTPNEALRIDGSGNIGIGTSSPGGILDISGATPIVNITATSGSAYLQVISANDSTSQLYMGDTDDANIGKIAYDQTTNAMTLVTNNVVAATINSDGSVTLPIGQLTFPAAANVSSDANTLDDYQEGTWTPVLGGSGGTSGQTYSVQVGAYTKIGRQVTAIGFIQLSAKGTITTDVEISGLPYTNVGSSGYSPVSFSLASNWALTADHHLEGYVGSSSAVINLRETQYQSDTVAALATANVENATEIAFSVSYFTAS